MTVAASLAPARAEPVVIAALGDSLVQGYGLPTNQGFVPQMQRWLDANGFDARLLNAGVSGDTTAGGLRRTDWTLTPEVDGLIVSLGGNDLLRGLDPDVSRSNLDRILKAARDKGLPILLVGIAAPGNYGAKYQKTFNAIFPDLSAKYETILYPDFLKAITQGGGTRSLERLLQSDRLHPNAEGVERIVNDMGPFVGKLVMQAVD